MPLTYNAWVNPSHIYRYAVGAFSANLAGTTGYDYLPAGLTAGDMVYFGLNPRFDDIQVNIGTALVATAFSGVWEYMQKLLSMLVPG